MTRLTLRIALALTLLVATTALAQESGSRRRQPPPTDTQQTTTQTDTSSTPPWVAAPKPNPAPKAAPPPPPPPQSRRETPPPPPPAARDQRHDRDRSATRPPDRYRPALPQREGHDVNAESRRAREHARQERSKFHHHAPPIRFAPQHHVVLRHVHIEPLTYHYRRAAFYDGWGWTAPSYVYLFYPRYGLWDTTFLFFALDHLDDEDFALMFYHHRYEPEMQSWLREARRAARTNAALRARLRMLDIQMAMLEEQEIELDASYVPRGVEDLAFAPEVIDVIPRDYR